MSSRASRSTSSEVFLGVDGGGTSTVLVLALADGTELARREAPTTYYLGAGLDRVGEVLTAGVGQVCGDGGVSPEEVSFAFFGLPGYGEVAGDVAALDAAPRSALGHDRYRCGNDMVCAWAGSLGAEDGANVVCGTGSIAYAERAGASVRVGGWGEVFGDEGSGYWVAVRALGHFAEMSDGRRPRGPLHDLLREHLHLGDDLELVDLVLHRWRADRTQIAGLSRVVAAAAESGDDAATDVLSEAADALAAHVDAARRGLDWPESEPMPVSWSGGMFAIDHLRDDFVRRLASADGRYDVRAPLHDPALGAALHAARLSKETR